MPQNAPFGTWKSPFTAEYIAAGLRLGEVGYDTSTETLLWLEGRGKKGVIVCLQEGKKFDLPYPYSIKAKVGYGGGDFAAFEGEVLFSCAKTGRLMRQKIDPNSEALALTPTSGFCSTPRLSPDGELVLYVHHDPNSKIDCLAVVDREGKRWPAKVAEGHDFYSHPRWRPDGQEIVYVAWDDPNMPWDASNVFIKGVGPLAEERAISKTLDGSVFQPEFVDNDTVVFCGDHTGFNELYRYNLISEQLDQLTDLKKDLAMPNWIQDMRQFAVLSENEVVCIINDRGYMSVNRLQFRDGLQIAAAKSTALYSEFSQIIGAGANRILFLGSSSSVPQEVVCCDLGANTVKPVASSLAADSKECPPIATQDYSRPEVVEWETTGDDKAYGLFYPPHNRNYVADGKPPLICLIHGGPTAQANAGFDLKAQAWSSRGFAVLQVNHRGSSGFGRAYIEKLRGQWGVYDVEDTISGARALARRDCIDLGRVAIMGGSAGGYTALQAMVTYPDFFAVGVSLYGIANQLTMATDTHKFEERYLDSLLGPLPESENLYRARSPLFNADRIRRPMAIYQGAEDQVVPLNQSEQIVGSLEKNGIPHIFHVYQGEGHGFRKPETLRHFYETLEQFFKEYLL